MNTKVIKSALHDTLPVFAGYMVLGMGFGMIMHASGYGIAFAVAMSLFIYAGSMQYAAVGLFLDGVPLLTIALTTLVVNARHLFYGISMIDKYKGSGIRKAYMIFALTDETYSIVCNSSKGTDYYFYVSLINHIYWVAGTAIGALAGGLVRFNTKGLDFALTAMFITIFTDQWINSEDHIPALIGIAVTAACRIIFGSSSFLIPSMIIILGLLLLLPKIRKPAGKENHD